MASEKAAGSAFRPAVIVVAAIIGGFAIADMSFLIARAPGLLLPSHWSGLLNLLMTLVAIYLLSFSLCFFFVLYLYFACRLLKRGLSSEALGFWGVVGTALSLILVSSLQARILGSYISLNSPLFLLPIGISLLILLVTSLVLILLSPVIPGFAFIVKGKLRTARIVILSALVFTLVAAVKGPHINVLGLFKPGEERAKSRERVPENPVKADKGAPNFVMVIIECFRNDVFNQENAPFLWKLARENYYFSRYYVTAPATRPSVTSFFTSLYPAQHGCYNMQGGRAASGGRLLTRAPEQADAIAKVLQQNGYRTLMVTSNSLTLDLEFGFESIFNRFSTTEPYRFGFPSPEQFLGFRFLRWYLGYFRIFKILFFSPEHSTSYFDGPRLNRTIIRELGKKDDRPFCLYVHYIEPHSPYYKHPYNPIQVNLYLPSRREEMMEAYLSEIRAADSVVSSLFAELGKMGVLENTYFFITSDHGEEFHDHGAWGHGKTLYPEVIHVPAILVPPPSKGRAARIDRIVQNIDVPPTIADLAGLPHSPSWEGRSLVPLMMGEEGGGSGRNDLESSRIAFGQFDDGHTFQAFAIADSLEIIVKLTGSRERVMMFNLVKDPGAKVNIFNENEPPGNELLDILDEKLRELYEKASRMRGGEETIDEQLMEQLRTLGYID